MPVIRSMASLLLFILYGVTSASAVFMLKMAMARPGGIAAWRGETGLLLGSGAMLYAFSFLIWLLLLARLPLAVAYPSAIGITLILSLVLASLVLHERMDASRLAGVALIFSGIVLLTRQTS